MFRSRKTHRRERSKAFHSRRLRVESMESRMMLAASGLDLSTYSVDQPQLTLSIASFPIASYALSSAPNNEGGFLNYNSDTPYNRDQFVGQFSSDSVLPVFDVNATGSAQGPELYSNSNWSQSTGLNGAVIVAGDNNGTLSYSEFRPIVIGPIPGARSVSDGGSIPIHAIFADFRKDSQLATGVKAVAAPAVQATIESLTSTSSSSSDNALAGEWARAMVFEVAGGEPTASDLHSFGQHGTDSSDSLQTAEPLSSVESSGQIHKNAAHSATATPSVDLTANPTTSPRTAEQRQQLAALLSQLVDSAKLAAGVTVPLSAADFAATNLMGIAAPDSKEVATAAVFDQLGDSNVAAIESSSFEGKTWLRALGFSPLLMVLAVERIAALNARRGARESRLAPAKKLVRLRG